MIRLPGRSRTAFKNYIFLGALVIALGSFFYTQSLVRRLEDASKTITKMFAEFYAKMSLPATATSSVETGIFFEQIVMKITFPVIFTDERGVPTAWRNIGISPDVISREELAAVDPENPPRVLERVFNTITKLDSEHEPIPMNFGRRVVGYVHYGESRAVRELRWAPVIQLVVIALFVIVGFLGFKAIRVAEENFIWAGMAKETAHQLGTPISSLLGWLEVLKDSGKRKTKEEIISEMGRDLARLESVTSRFNRIGSPPRFERKDLTGMLSETADYFRLRLPKHGKRIEIVEHHEPIPEVDVDEELFRWAIENLVRNSLDAIRGGSGKIEISAGCLSSEPAVEIRVRDNGRGMSRDEKRRAFMPGYTTKKFGWGLGLPLAKRIIENYHGGRLLIESSQPGKGTCFLIRMRTQGNIR